MDDFWQSIRELPLFPPMLVIAVGYTLGRLSFRKIALGPAGATLFVALGLGATGWFPTPGEAAEALGILGFSLFIYSVGFDAAPHLASQLRDRRGLSFLFSGALVNLVAFGSVFGLGLGLGIDPSVAAGLLAGALTSPPTFAAASEVANDPTSLSVAFALTYPVGLLGLVILIQVLPRLLGQDLAADAVSEEEIVAREGGKQQAEAGTPEFSRAYEVKVREVIGRSLRELELTRTTGCVISRIHRLGGDGSDEVLIPDGDTRLLLDDHVVVTGRIDELKLFEEAVGPEAFDQELQTPRLPSRRVQIRSRKVFGQPLRELRSIDRHHCVITRIERGNLWIEPGPDVVLRRGDVVEVVGKRDDVRRFALELGRFEPPGHETDIAVYAGGILLGLGVGSLAVQLGGFRLSLGLAGGLLLVGLLMGLRRQLGPFRTHVPREARQLVRDLGISLFVAEAGLQAGPSLGEAITDAPFQWLGLAAVVHLAAVLIPLVIVRKALGLRALDAWGSVCGGMTSSAALQTVRRAADSSDVAASYAAAYAIASVLATLAGPGVIWALGG